MHGSRRHDDTRYAVVALIAGGLLWGLTWMPIKHFGGHGLTGFTLTLATYGVVGVLTLPLFLAQRARWQQQWPALLLVAVFGGLANLCFVVALMDGPVMRVMLLFYLAPIWGVIGGRLFFGERLTAPRLLAVGMAVIGAILVLGGPETLLGAALTWLDFVAIAAGLLYAGQNIAARAADQIPLLSKSLSVFIGCGIVGAIGIPFAERGFVPISLTLALQLGAFGAIWLMAAVFATLYGVSRLEAGRAAVLIVFELVAAVVSAMVIAGERLDAMGWTGAALISGAALLEARATPSN